MGEWNKRLYPLKQNNANQKPEMFKCKIVS